MVIRNEKDAIFYLTDCTLATVATMALLKGRKKSEYERQISIAQKGMNFIVLMYGVYKETLIPMGISNRIWTVANNHNVSVSEWAKTYKKK